MMKTPITQCPQIKTPKTIQMEKNSITVPSKLRHFSESNSNITLTLGWKHCQKYTNAYTARKILFKELMENCMFKIKSSAENELSFSFSHLIRKLVAMCGYRIN